MTSEIPVERDIPAIMQSFCLMVIPFPRAFFKYHYQDYNIMLHLSAHSGDYVPLLLSLQ